MTQAKNELLFTNMLSKDVLSNISSFLTFPLFRESILQKRRLLDRLAKYAAEGNIDKVVSLLTLRPDLRTEVLFTLAGLGAQDQMEPLLEQRPEDLLIYHPLRDISGACFINSSLFQHAIWTKDVRYMANMMLDCLPKSTKGEAIRLEMVRQYEELMAQGVDYQLNGVMHEKEHHFSVQPLITALDTYVTNHDDWTDKERTVHWCTVVGLAQTLLPAHIRHHYCDPEEPFNGNTNFQKPKLQRSLEIYNCVLGKSQLWVAGHPGLGMNFGIGRGGRRKMAWGGAERLGLLAGRDLAVIKSLDEMRTSLDMASLIKRLYTPIQNLEETPTVQGLKC